jgi:hypothetical protein
MDLSVCIVLQLLTVYLSETAMRPSRRDSQCKMDSRIEVRRAGLVLDKSLSCTASHIARLKIVKQSTRTDQFSSISDAAPSAEIEITTGRNARPHA